MTPETHLNRTLPLLLHIATATTGLIDAISYLGLGHVFTANMTGNVVFLAFAVAGAPGLSIPRSLTALVAFFIGAVIGGRLATRLAELVRPNWVTIALSLEAALLLVATLAAINFRDSSGSLFQSYSIIVLTAQGDEDSVRRCFELGATDFLSKPFSPPQLDARVRSCFARAAAH